LLKFYTNRELADNLSINLAKWKRWSREFLPPDPLGGMQSGYTRQYNIDDAFTVYLGGHLVSAIKYTIPETKTILHDLHEWMSSVGIYKNSGKDIPDNLGPTMPVKRYTIFIQPRSVASGSSPDFLYSIRGIIDETTEQHKPFLIRRERYVETSIPLQKQKRAVSESAGVKVLNITAVLNQFVEGLSIPQTPYNLSDRG
jgi:hypothetical protein